MSAFVLTSKGNRIPLPEGDSPVARHIASPASHVPRLLQQINDEKIYDFAFRNADGWTMLDIGANLGLVSLYASDSCREIIALEPSLIFENLRTLCAIKPHIHPMPLALAGHNGSAQFMFNDVNTTASSMAQTYGTISRVETITLSSLLQYAGLKEVHFAKIDVEGSETECLTPIEIERCKYAIRSYFVEVHNCPNSTWETKMGQLTERFTRAGYRRIRIRGDSLFACIQ